MCSSDLKELLADVEELGEENFEREILRLCKTRGECNYWETKIIFEKDCVIRDSYYNSFVGCKVHSKHVKHLLIEDSDG